MGDEDTPRELNDFAFNHFVSTESVTTFDTCDLDLAKTGVPFLTSGLEPDVLEPEPEPEPEPKPLLLTNLKE
ncbi:hypothetical protein Hanom_Chr04g00299531 [Helianthus anomalus]